jgi:uncharacterized lipoprotein YmbA
MSRRLVLPGLCLALALAGCAGQAPPTHYYTLVPESPAEPTGREGGGLSIGVERLVVDPPYDQERLVYREAAGSAEIGFYNYHRWAAPLSRMLAVSLAARLGGTPGVGAIEPTRAGAEYTARLRGRVVAWEEVDLAGGAEARLVLDLALVEPNGDELWTATLTATSSGPVASGADAMDLVQRAFADLVGQVREGLAAALAPTP